MKKLVLLAPVMLVSGCFDDTADLTAHMEQVKAQTTNYIEPIPEAPEFHHVEYSASLKRSPFVAPKTRSNSRKVTANVRMFKPRPS